MRSTINATLRARTVLRSRHTCGALAGAILTLLVAGCASSSAAPPPQTAAHPQVTPVPTVLVAYGSAALNTVKVTLQQGQQLASQMKHNAPEDAGLACSNSAPLFSGQYDAFQSVYLPPSAHSVYGDARTGYRTVLSAIDECGMAADENARAQMRVALRDLNSGLWYLGRVQNRLQSWSGAH